MTKRARFEASCHCHSVQISITRLPEFMHNCNCSLCRKSGAVWGYFGGADVLISGATESYLRTDLASPTVQIHFCCSCGSTTHWSFTENRKSQSDCSDRMGVNMRLFETDLLAGIELRFPNGKDWNGEEEFGYYREAIMLAKGMHP